MYFSICNDVNVRNYNLNGKRSILIRCLEPDYLNSGIPYNINNIDKYVDILELYIYDYSSEVKENKFVFDIKKALLLNKFILSNDFDEIVVHCSMGISRSPAIMICIAKILNNKDLEDIIKDKYKFYNRDIVDFFEKSDYLKKDIFIEEILGNILEKKLILIIFIIVVLF